MTSINLISNALAPAKLEAQDLSDEEFMNIPRPLKRQNSCEMVYSDELDGNMDSADSDEDEEAE